MWESLSQCGNDLLRVIHAERRLGENRDFFGIWNLNVPGVLDTSDNSHPSRCLAASADNFIVRFVTYQNHPITLSRESAHFAVDLVHQRAGGIDNGFDLSLSRFLPRHRGDAMGAE